MKYINIARKYLNENYNFEDREITNYDFVMMGVAIGVALVAIKSFMLTAAVLAILIHLSFKKK